MHTGKDRKCFSKEDGACTVDTPSAIRHVLTRAVAAAENYYGCFNGGKSDDGCGASRLSGVDEFFGAATKNSNFIINEDEKGVNAATSTSGTATYGACSEESFVDDKN